MNILLACNEMVSLTGSPLYHYTLAKELRQQGHRVFIFSIWGKRFKDLPRFGVIKYGSMHRNINFDLFLVSQPIMEEVIDKIRAKKVVNVVHSEYPCETPMTHKRIDHYIAIRPEIKQHLIDYHEIPEDKISVIYNGIDTKRFSTNKRKKHEGDYTKVVLPCSIHPLRAKFINYYTKQACEKYRVYIYGKTTGNAKIYRNEWVFISDEKENIEDYIADADIVAGILLGRINLEAYNMGIPNYIHDPDNPKKKYLYSIDKEEFNNRHNIKNVAKQITNLYENTRSNKQDTYRWH